MMSIFHFLLISLLWRAFREPASQNPPHKGALTSVSSFLSLIVSILSILSLILLVGLFLFAFLLLVYHSYLLATNQTTWEHTKRKELDYIKIYPNRYLPFDRGFCRNISFCLFPGQKDPLGPPTKQPTTLQESLLDNRLIKSGDCKKRNPLSNLSNFSNLATEPISTVTDWRLRDVNKVWLEGHKTSILNNPVVHFCC